MLATSQANPVQVSITAAHTGEPAGPHTTQYRLLLHRVVKSDVFHLPVNRYFFQLSTRLLVLIDVFPHLLTMHGPNARHEILSMVFV